MAEPHYFIEASEDTPCSICDQPADEHKSSWFIGCKVWTPDGLAPLTHEFGPWVRIVEEDSSK